MEYKVEKKEETTVPTNYGLGLRFDTEYNEKTGLLGIFNLGLVRNNGCRELDTKRAATVYAPGAGMWSSGTLVHVLFQFNDDDEHTPHDLGVVCNFAMAFLDREKAERAFSEAEEGMWESIESRRVSCPGKDFSVVKVNKWHCDLLECVLTERGGWKRPGKGDTWWLECLMLE